MKTSPRPQQSESPNASLLAERYSRALQLTGPKLANATTGRATPGYWIDNEQFFFLAERFEPSLGRVIDVPSIVDMPSNQVAEVMPLDRLARLLSIESGQAIDLEALSNAEFDVPIRASLAVALNGHDYLVDVRRKCILERAAQPTSPALYSPDRRYACVIREHDLWLMDRQSGVERALTRDGAAHRAYAQQSETTPPFVSYRERPHPVGVWSPDSRWFLTHQINEQSLPTLPIVQHVPPGSGRPVLHCFKHAIPGDPLPLATLVAIEVTSGRIVRLEDYKVPVTADCLFGMRMVWFSGSDQVWFVRRDRYCKEADLVKVDLATGEARVVINERVASGYLDLNPFMGSWPNARTLTASDEVIWFSEREGWGHLYLYDARSGALKNRITRGDWLVRDIVHVDEARRTIFFLAGGVDPHADPARRSLCSVNFDGTEFETLLLHDGDLYVPVNEPSGLPRDRLFRPSSGPRGISPNGRFVVAQYSSVERGNRTEIVELKKGHRVTIASASPSKDEIAPRHFSATAADGLTKLHGVMFLPSDFDEHRSYPLVAYIYPGPQTAQQPQSFQAMTSTIARALAELGFVTIMLNPRGLPIGSREFHQGGYPALLEPQVTDHAAVVRQLCKRHSFIDANRVGIMGYSAGGAATMRALCEHSDIFKAGVSACGYEEVSFCTASWSDKYRGAQSAPASPGELSPAVLAKLQGKLLLISGDMDESVPVSRTLALTHALMRANKDFDLLIVPNEGHGVLLLNGYVQRRVWDFFVRHLLGETPPADFEVRFEAHELARFRKVFMREVLQ